MAISLDIDFSTALADLHRILALFPPGLEDEASDINISCGRAAVRRLGRSEVTDVVVPPVLIASLAGSMASAFDIEIHRMMPKIEKRLPPRYRVTLSHPSITQDGTWGLSIRFLPTRIIPLAEYLDNGFMTVDVGKRLVELASTRNTMLIAGATGSGKAQPIDEPVLTPTGWRPIGDLIPGDRVLGPDGRSAQVRSVHPQGIKPIVRIRFRDGREARCSTDHLWQVWRRVPADGQQWSWQVRTAAQIARSVERGTKHARRHGIPMVDPDGIGGAPQELPIPPYALGVLIGDGSLSIGPTPRISNPNGGVRARFEAAIAATGHELRHVARDMDYSVVARRGSVPMGRLLRGLGLMGCRSHEKFIPPIYLEALPTDRLELLRGLLDTDGDVGRLGTISYSTSSKQLAEDVQKLVWSLGGLARLGCKKAPQYTYRGEKRTGRESWRVGILHDNPSELLTRDHRLERTQVKRNWPQNALRLPIRAIEPAGQAECVCIAVDRPDGLYVTRDYIVTHNTTLLRAIIAEVPERDRLVIIESGAELNVQRENMQALEDTDGASFDDLIAHCLRLDPDLIVVGEVRGREASRFVTIAAAGHPCATTIHAESGEKALIRLMRMIRLAEPHFDRAELEGAIQAVCHVRLDPNTGHRAVTLWPEPE